MRSTRRVEAGDVMDTQVDTEVDELKLRLDEIDQARRQVGQWIEGSGIAMQRALRATARSAAGRSSATDIGHLQDPVQTADSWPRVTRQKAPSHPYRRAITIGLVFVVILLGAAVRLQRTVPQTIHVPAAVQAVAPTPAPVAAPPQEPVAVAAPLIRLRATTPSRVRITVDGTALDWRVLKSGDEFVLRPAREIRIESADASGIVSTVDGRPASLEEINSLFQQPPK
jgi:hypothetical protein